jgi:hypothetical protein
VNGFIESDSRSERCTIDTLNSQTRIDRCRLAEVIRTRFFLGCNPDGPVPCCSILFINSVCSWSPISEPLSAWNPLGRTLFLSGVLEDINSCCLSCYRHNVGSDAVSFSFWDYASYACMVLPCTLVSTSAPGISPACTTSSVNGGSSNSAPPAKKGKTAASVAAASSTGNTFLICHALIIPLLCQGTL